MALAELLRKADAEPDVDRQGERNGYRDRHWDTRVGTLEPLGEELDIEVERFRTRKLDGVYPYVWVDATFLKVRQDHRVVNMAVAIAVGLNATTGQREVLGVDIGPSEYGAVWLRFL